MPFRTYRHGDWRQSFPTEAQEATSHQSQGRASGSFSRSSLMSEDSMSSRSRASQRKVKKKKSRPSKSTYSVESAQMLTSLSEPSRPDLQAHRVPGFSMEVDSKDFQIFSEGLLEGSIFGAFGADHLKSLAPEVQLYRFAPAEAASRKEFPCPYVFIIRDGCFIMGDNSTKESITLGPSCVFGEINLWGVHSDLMAGEAGGTCLAISKETFLEALKKVTREIASENYHFLLRTALFEYLDVSYLAMLSKCSCNVSYSHGKVIKEEGPGSFMYLVKKGMVIESVASGQSSLHLPGDSLGCGRLQAEGDTELVAWQLPSLQALLGFRGTDFFWRCALLSSLRGAWSSHAGHSTALAYRDNPEELARACIIITAFGHSALPECLGPASSIEWFMLLDGSLTVEVSGVSYPLKPNDSMPWRDANGTTLQLPDEVEATTLALLMKDAVLPTEEGDEEEKLRWVKQVFLFRTLDHREQQLLSSAARRVPRQRGEVIFEEGDLASQCFVVVEGEMAQWKEGRLIRTLGSFSTFGERELLNQLPRSFSVTCKSESAMLMAIDKMVFEHVVKERVFAQLQDQLQLRRMDIEMADLHEISTLGYGTFGIVRLVEHHPSGARYALKCISRTEAVARRQQTSICTEREILTDVDHPFILKLVQTFKDRRNVYFLTEFVTGGELFGAIRSLGILNGSQARFYTGSLILALQALHEKMIIYRDLKPENVLLDNYGYIKLIDFGCAARLNKGGHRSLVGTPHYMAPEVILGKEYNCSCDVWSLGVCLYEFVCGPLPFGQDLEDPKQVFQEILLAKVSFPEHFTNLTGKHLLRSLLRKNSQLRIGGVNGLQDVREHEYFRKFSFARLLGRNLEPPLVSSPPGTPRKDEGAIPQDPSESEPLEAREISESEDWAAEF